MPSYMKDLAAYGHRCGRSTAIAPLPSLVYEMLKNEDYGDRVGTRTANRDQVPRGQSTSAAGRSVRRPGCSSNCWRSSTATSSVANRVRRRRGRGAGDACAERPAPPDRHQRSGATPGRRPGRTLAQALTAAPRRQPIQALDHDQRRDRQHQLLRNVVDLLKRAGSAPSGEVQAADDGPGARGVPAVDPAPSRRWCGRAAGETKRALAAR